MKSKKLLNRLLGSTLMFLVAGSLCVKAQASSPGEDLQYAQRLLLKVLSSDALSGAEREKISTAYEKVMNARDQISSGSTALLVSSTFDTGGGSGGSYRLCSHALNNLMSASNEELTITGHCANDYSSPEHGARAHIKVTVRQ